LLLVVVRYSYDNFVEQFSRTLNYIQMAIGHRIETPRINCASHVGKFADQPQDGKPDDKR
jgi:hypothetical protein